MELLFKNLNIQLQDVTPSSLLVGRRRESVDNMDFQAQRPISQGGAAAATPAKASEGGTPTAAGEAKPVPAAPGAAPGEEGSGGLCVAQVARPAMPCAPALACQPLCLGCAPGIARARPDLLPFQQSCLRCLAGPK